MPSSNGNMKNTLNLQIDTAATPREGFAPAQQPKTTHALDVNILLGRIAEARVARATMSAALGAAPNTGIPVLASPLPRAAPTPFAQVCVVNVKPRKTAPCKLFAQGRCPVGDACDLFVSSSFVDPLCFKLRR